MLHLLPVAALSQLIGFVSLYAGSETPYRQPVPLLQNRDPVSIRGSTLLLGPNYATYFQDLDRISNAAGFTAGTPIIDLTGTSAASLSAMRAKAIGQPWHIRAARHLLFSRCEKCSAAISKQHGCSRSQRAPADYQTASLSS
jgi:hypothetical protein